MIHNSKFAFFGSSELSVYVLDELLLHGVKPSLIITLPDAPKGRKLVLTPNIVKTWAEKNNVPFLTPASLKNLDDDSRFIIHNSLFDFFLVASYGKIIPKDIFEIPKYKTLNIHPSLLPKYRGASPIQAQILNREKNIGVSIMQIEETMDTGPVLVKKISPPAPLNLRGGPEGEPWQMGRIELEKILAREGARILTHTLPEYLSGAIQPIIQNEDEATYCKKITKEDGELQIDLKDMSKNSLSNFAKIKAYEGWPGTYFFYEGKRVIVKEAALEGDKLSLIRVLPEGKSEMSFADYLRGLKPA